MTDCLGEVSRPQAARKGGEWRSLAGQLPALVLLTADGASFALSFGLIARLGMLTDAPVEMKRAMLLAALVCIGLLKIGALYPGYRLHAYEALRRRVLANGTVVLLSVATAALVFGDLAAAGTIGAFLALALLFQLVLGRLGRALLLWTGIWGMPVTIAAEPELTARIADYLRTHRHLGLNPAAEPALGDWSVARTILLADCRIPDPQRLAEMRRRYDEVILLADAPELRLSGLQPHDASGAIGLKLGLTGPSFAERGLRRALDILLASLAAVCFAPIMALGALAVWIVDPGPVIYRQAREGRGGATIRVLKLRTMFQDADQRLERLLAADPAARQEWSKHFKLKHDPRILPGIGKLLRSTSCDELPQLFNIIAGSMSLVGPRPFPTYHLAEMGSDFRKKRAGVLPGLTGLLQVSARSDANLSLQQSIDEFYLNNRSLWLDLYIMLRTTLVIFRRNGAY